MSLHLLQLLLDSSDDIAISRHRPMPFCQLALQLLQQGLLLRADVTLGKAFAQLRQQAFNILFGLGAGFLEGWHAWAAIMHARRAEQSLFRWQCALCLR